MGKQTLILGMHRSGTTLLADIFRKHDSVKHVFNESVLLHLSKEQLLKTREFDDHQLIQSKGVLNRASNVTRVKVTCDFDLLESHWAAKMSYPGPVILQEWQDTTAKYAKQWLDSFGQKARILLIVRHPFDVYLSASARWSDHQRHVDNYGTVTLDHICRDWCYTLDSLQGLIESDNRVLKIKYESLLANPETNIVKIFRHCNLNHEADVIEHILNLDIVFFGKLRVDRAFRYRKEKLVPDLSASTEVLLSTQFDDLGYKNDVSQ